MFQVGDKDAMYCAPKCEVILDESFTAATFTKMSAQIPKSQIEKALYRKFADKANKDRANYIIQALGKQPTYTNSRSRQYEHTLSRTQYINTLNTHTQPT